MSVLWWYPGQGKVFVWVSIHATSCSFHWGSQQALLNVWHVKQFTIPSLSRLVSHCEEAELTKLRQHRNKEFKLFKLGYQLHTSQGMQWHSHRWQLAHPSRCSYHQEIEWKIDCQWPWWLSNLSRWDKNKKSIHQNVGWSLKLIGCKVPGRICNFRSQNGWPLCVGDIKVSDDVNKILDDCTVHEIRFWLWPSATIQHHRWP